jgi:hypothetical protein
MATACRALGIMFLLAVHNLSSHGVYECTTVSATKRQEFEVPDSPMCAVGNKGHIPGILPVAKRRE